MIDDEIDISNIGKSTKNIFKQNPVYNRSCIVYELEDVLKRVILNHFIIFIHFICFRL